MKITKYENSCLDIVSGKTRVIIDPGVFTKKLQDYAGVNAVVVTHIHPDHFAPDNLQRIIAANPGVAIYTTEEISKEFNTNVTVAQISQTYKAGEIALEFFGGAHAQISSNLPLAQNIGVLVGDVLYYPGDSLTPCPKPHSVLALPVMAPWLKFSEAEAFMAKSSATKVFASHNQFINEDGQNLYNRLVGNACQQQNKTYKFLDVGESI